MRSSASVLGVLLPLLAASEASAQEDTFNQYVPPRQMTVSPLGVDLQSGRFSHSVTDLSIGPLTLERSYVDGHEVVGSNHFGRNWNHNHAIYAWEKTLWREGGIAVVIGNKTFRFSRRAGGTAEWFGPDEEGSFLEGDNQQNYVFTDQLGNVYRFKPWDGSTSTSQRIDRIEYADGHTVTYSFNGRQLTRISSNYGYSIVLEYANGFVSKACGYNHAFQSAPSKCVTYEIPLPTQARPWVNLTGVIDAAGQRWEYEYVGTSNIGELTCVKKNSSTCLVRNEYTERRGQVSRQITADGSVWNYRFDRPDPDYDMYASHGVREITGGGYTDPEGNSVWLELYSGQPKKYYENGKVDSPGWNGNQARVTEFTWNGLELVKLTHKEGNSVTYSRRGSHTDETWTPKPASGLAPVYTSSGFPARGPDGNSNSCDLSVGRKRCNKPLWTEDFNRNRTDYTYDPQHGGVLTETGPAVNDVRPQKRYTYVAKTSNAAPAGPPVWLVNTVSFCRSSNFKDGSCGRAGDEVVTTFEYEPNNLNLRSETVTAKEGSRRTCYSYDWQGNQISTTTPKGTCS